MAQSLRKQVSWLGLFYLCIYNAAGQQPYELKISSANDNYCFQYHDGYYTNGLFLRLNYLPRRFNQVDSVNRTLTKVIGYYQAGQMMFTTDLLRSTAVDQIDRPYAGYLFVQKGMTFFYRKGHVFNANISVGMIGPASLAEQTQLLVHKTFDLILPSAKLWSYQVKNELGVNLQAQYWHDLLPLTERRRWIDVHGMTQLTVGNTFTNASAGLLLQTGFFENPAHSSLYDARLEPGRSTRRKPLELYAFYRPSYQYQVYNATVEGRLFSSNTGSVLSPINRWVFMQDVGVVYAQRRWTFQLVYSYKEKEALTMHHSEQYITLTTGYCFNEKKLK